MLYCTHMSHMPLHVHMCLFHDMKSHCCWFGVLFLPHPLTSYLPYSSMRLSQALIRFFFFFQPCQKGASFLIIIPCVTYLLFIFFLLFYDKRQKGFHLIKEKEKKRGKKYIKNYESVKCFDVTCQNGNHFSAGLLHLWKNKQTCIEQHTKNKQTIDLFLTCLNSTVCFIYKHYRVVAFHLLLQGTFMSMSIHELLLFVASVVLFPCIMTVSCGFDFQQSGLINCLLWRLRDLTLSGISRILLSKLCIILQLDAFIQPQHDVVQGCQLT